MTFDCDVAIIGAGIAGLTSGALLQRDGARVLLLERHDKPGGCAGYFAAGEFCFPVGATVALGLEASGLHRRVFDYLGIETPPAHRLECLRVLLPSRELSLWHNAAKWRRERRQLPGNRIGQELFWRLQETLADAGWRALGRLPSLPLQTARDLRRNVRLCDPRLLPLLPFLGSTVGDILRALRVQNDREFVALVNLLLIITVQSEAGQAPVTNGCAGLDLFRHGAFHPHGGIGTLAQTLLRAFEQCGGQAHLGEEVCAVRPQRGGFEIRTSQGVYRAGRVVANVPLQNLARLVELTPRARRNVARQDAKCGEGWGAVNAYCAVRDEAVANAPLHQQVLLDFDARPGDGRDTFLSLSLPGDEAQAPIGWRALNISTHTRLSEWEGLSPGQYRLKKREWRERLLQGARRGLPDFDAGRGFVILGTPRSWQDYTGRARGSVGGAPLTLANANLRALPQRLGLRNLWLCGDTTFPGQGTVACALSGINVWRDIVGRTTL